MVTGARDRTWRERFLYQNADRLLSVASWVFVYEVGFEVYHDIPCDHFDAGFGLIGLTTIYRHKFDVGLC